MFGENGLDPLWTGKLPSSIAMSADEAAAASAGILDLRRPAWDVERTNFADAARSCGTTSCPIWPPAAVMRTVRSAAAMIPFFAMDCVGCYCEELLYSHTSPSPDPATQHLFLCTLCNNKRQINMSSSRPRNRVLISSPRPSIFHHSPYGCNVVSLHSLDFWENISTKNQHCLARTNERQQNDIPSPYGNDVSLKRKGKLTHAHG